MRTPLNLKPRYMQISKEISTTAWESVTVSVQQMYDSNRA